MKNCPKCSAVLDDVDSSCRYCGAEIGGRSSRSGDDIKAEYDRMQQERQANEQQANTAPPQQNNNAWQQQNVNPGNVPPYYNQQPPAQHYQQPYQQPYTSANYRNVNRVVAGILAILIGCFGVHKFYMGKIGMGVLYILFCWTGIPTIIGFIEGIIYLVMNDHDFMEKYCRIN